MIRQVVVRGFKSLVEFSIELGAFSCLVGLNGAGKSSLLQSLDFASHLMKGDVAQWLTRRNWGASDLHSKLSSASNIFISIVVEDEAERKFRWRAAFNRTSLNCTREDVYELGSGEKIFDSWRGRYSIGNGESSKIDFNFKGSLLSSLKSEIIGPDLIFLREQIASIRSLELLSPHLMRSTPRDSTTDIGVGGEKLSPFLYSVKGDAKERLVASLKNFYPSVVDYKVKQERAGWKRLYLIEEFDGQRVETEAKHVNDGLLRVLAILAQAGSGKSLLLFDEIENGINPEIVEKLVDILQQTPQQILVTTHSPLILNYLSDDVAKKSVHFIYRSARGGTKSRLLFDIPRMGEKLQFMGAGEAFVDTSLMRLTEECVLSDAAEEQGRAASEGAKS